MWLDFEHLAGDGGTLAFNFPKHRPPHWRQRWQALVRHVTVTRSHEAKDAMLDAFANGSGVRTLGFVNAHAFNTCVRNPAFARDLLALDHIVRDGIGVGALYRLIGSHSGLNLNGTDLLPELIARFAGQKIALFGTQLPLVEAVAATLTRELGCQVVTADGFQPDGHYLQIVAQTRPALVVLGMGMPKQERVARQMRHGLHQDVAIVCGGAILDFLSGHKPRAPRWMRAAGLEWAFRLSLEPKRLFGRYVIGNPLFLLRSVLLALRPKATQAQQRSLPKRHAITEPYGIGGPITATVQPSAFDATPPAGGPQSDIATRNGEQDAQAAAPRAAAPLASVVSLHAATAPQQVRTSAESVFSANRPVVARNDLFGRQHDLDRLLAWVLDQSGNALIYGPRGYGKTSLVRVFGEIADGHGHVVIYAACSRNADFDALIRSYLTEIPEIVPPSALAGTAPFGVRQIANLLAEVKGTSLVFIVDEFDRIERDDTRQSLVELIKDVSDLTASVRFVLVGVATDATAILGYHPSVQRCITCMPLARLDGDDIRDLFTRKARADELVVDDPEVETVVELTAGSAYLAQLVGQKLVACTRRSGNTQVKSTDLDQVINEIITESALIDAGFARLAQAMHQQEAGDVLVRLARMSLAGHDDLISFPAAQPPSDLRRICVGLVADGVCQQVDTGDGSATFRFNNAFVPQLLLMIEHRANTSQPDANSASPHAESLRKEQ